MNVEIRNQDEDKLTLFLLDAMNQFVSYVNFTNKHRYCCLFFAALSALRQHLKPLHPVKAVLCANPNIAKAPLKGDHVYLMQTISLLDELSRSGFTCGAFLLFVLSGESCLTRKDAGLRGSFQTGREASLLRAALAHPYPLARTHKCGSSARMPERVMHPRVMWMHHFVFGC